MNDPWWADKVSNDDDLFDVDDIGVGVGPSTRNVNNSKVQVESTNDSIDDGNDERATDVSDDENDGSDSGEENGAQSEGMMVIRH